MTALICMVTCGALFSTDVQAAQKTVRVKEKTEITYLVGENGTRETVEKVRTEYIYSETAVPAHVHEKQIGRVPTGPI